MQGFEMSPWLLIIYMDGVVREAYERTQRRKVKMIDQNNRSSVVSYSTTFFRLSEVNSSSTL